jgi:hypothetical protein
MPTQRVRRAGGARWKIRCVETRHLSSTDLAEICAALERRVDDCWERLQDAAVELAHVHQVPIEELVDRVAKSVAADDESDARAGG